VYVTNFAVLVDMTYLKQKMVILAQLVCHVWLCATICNHLCHTVIFLHVSDTSAVLK